MDKFEDIIQGTTPVLVDYFATWCGPCRMQSPIIEKVKEEIGDAANVIKVDIDKNEAVARKYNVQSIPTLIMFKNGEPAWRAVGLQQADVLVVKIKEFI